MKQTIIFLVLLCGLSAAVSAKHGPNLKAKQNANITLNVAASNRHLWRCGQSINGLSIQSSLSYNLPFLSVGAWGAYEVAAHSYAEVDIFVKAYFLKYFTLGIFDFYNPHDRGGRIRKDFSHFKSSPGHAIDMYLSYSGTEALPFGGLVAAYVYGSGDKDQEGKQRYSTYLETNYTWTLNEDSKLFFYVGATTSKESAYAARKPIIINGVETMVPVSDNDFKIIGFGSKYTRHLMIGQFHANIAGEFLYNTNADAVYMAVSTSINF